MQEIWFTLLGILSLLFISSGSPEAAAAHPMLADAQTVLEITKDDRILGNPDAPIITKRGGGILVRLKAEWAAIVGVDWAALA